MTACESKITGWQPAVLVTGGRDHIPSRAHAEWFKYWLRAVRPAFVLNGGASGVDLWAEAIARAQGVVVRQSPVTKADWAAYQGAAGPMRNTVMLDQILKHGGGYCVVFEGNKGTADMMRKAKKHRLTLVNMQRPVYNPPPRQRTLWPES